MLRISKISIPVVAAALVLTARTQEPAAQPDQPSPARRQTEQAKDSAAAQEQRNQQSTFQPGQISDTQLKKTVTDVNKASSFIGMAVKNMQNENLGKIHDLVFDPESGKISYAVISVGGVLGVGDKLVATPVTSLKPQPGQKYLTLNMDKNQLQSAPGLAQNNWPDLDASGIGAPAGSESATSGSSQPQSSAPSAPSQGENKTGTSNSDASATIPSTPAPSEKPAATEPDSSTSKSDSDSKDQ
jgi:sporulation protein YlmC with PRC-barrel domain